MARLTARNNCRSINPIVCLLALPSFFELEKRWPNAGGLKQSSGYMDVSVTMV
jgi:hypothetical protein